jgi:hypothetical protein
MMGFGCPSEQGCQLVWGAHQQQSMPVLPWETSEDIRTWRGA